MGARKRQSNETLARNSLVIKNVPRLTAMVCVCVERAGAIVFVRAEAFS